MYPYHDSSVVAGRMCRRLLKKFENLCKEVDGYDGEPLDITVCDDETVQMDRQPAKKTFRNLFQRKEVSAESLLVESNDLSGDLAQVSVEEESVSAVYPQRNSIADNTTDFGVSVSYLTVLS